MKVALLIPTLNEIDGMKIIMPKIRREWVDEVLIVDGGSTDGTVEYARELGYPVVFQEKKGLFNAYAEALAHIESEMVIAFSPDGNSVPEKIPELVAVAKQGYDMVIVSRYLGGTKSEDDDAITAFGNWVFTFLINLFYGSHYTDALVMYRAWRKDVFKNLEIGNTDTHAIPFCYIKAGAEPLLCIRAAKLGLKCKDIGGPEPARIGGERKLQVVVGGMSILLEILAELVVWRKK